MKKFLLKLALTRPCKVIYEGDTPYLERYFLFNLFGLKFNLHRIVGSDPDRGLHNHPWDWAISFILYNRYFEERDNKFRWISWFNFLTKNSKHRIHLPEYINGIKNECWTLFIYPNNYKHEWGFFRDGKFTAWVPRNRKNSNKNFWERKAFLGFQYERDENNIIKIGKIK